MARTKRIFVDSGEIRAVAEQLKKRYHDMLATVDLNQIFFAFCISERARNSRSATIRTSVSNPLPGMVITKPYQIAIYREDWDEWSDARRHASVLEQLCYIDEDGRYLKPDVQELYPFVATWGPDWRDDENLPDVLDETVEFARKIEIDDGEDGEDGKMDPILKDILDEEKNREMALAARSTDGMDNLDDSDDEKGDSIGSF